MIHFSLGDSPSPSSQEESVPNVSSAGESEGNIQFELLL